MRELSNRTSKCTQRVHSKVNQNHSPTFPQMRNSPHATKHEIVFSVDSHVVYLSFH